VLKEPLVARGGVMKYKIVQATCGSDQSLEVFIVESEFICSTLYVFTAAQESSVSMISICLIVSGTG